MGEPCSFDRGAAVRLLGERLPMTAAREKALPRFGSPFWRAVLYDMGQKDRSPVYFQPPATNLSRHLFSGVSAVRKIPPGKPRLKSHRQSLRRTGSEKEGPHKRTFVVFDDERTTVRPICSHDRCRRQARPQGHDDNRTVSTQQRERRGRKTHCGGGGGKRLCAKEGRECASPAARRRQDSGTETSCDAAATPPCATTSTQPASSSSSFSPRLLWREVNEQDFFGDERESLHAFRFQSSARRGKPGGLDERRRRVEAGRPVDWLWRPMQTQLDRRRMVLRWGEIHFISAIMLLLLRERQRERCKCSDGRSVRVFTAAFTYCVRARVAGCCGAEDEPTEERRRGPTERSLSLSSAAALTSAVVVVVVKMTPRAYLVSCLQLQAAGWRRRLGRPPTKKKRHTDTNTLGDDHSSELL
ncbi:hypothetical protein HPB50_000394 [Hyalomma asiaticum]|uniref:Uncharacterized protein n=1 Tax=Hyalomma asiaticum TaxID=266040 RepID=A0ACB7SCK6_HYAAI|nr:hypothetical protein HPB50_000394 [Hyalomma asiaticum]